MPETPLPEAIRRPLSGYATTGENHRTNSAAHIFLYQKPGAPDCFLKISSSDQDAPLVREKEAMIWLSGKLPVPRVIAYHEQSAIEYLLTERIPGHSAESDVHKAHIAQTVRLLAKGLRAIHAVPIAGCPLPDYNAEHLLAVAKDQIASGQVTAYTLAERGDMRTPAQALAEVRALKPNAATRVFTHGDYCLPNIMLHNSALTGFIDWGSAGTGDPHRDFVSAEYSIRRNLGADWVVPFYEAYGRERIDENTLAFYRAIYDLT